MVNLEILGGLKSALERGESLKRAMLTLFNAGYKKEEIEEAAQNLTTPENSKPAVQTPSVQTPKANSNMPNIPEAPSPPNEKEITNPLKKENKILNILKKKETAQKVSNYGAENQQKSNLVKKENNIKEELPKENSQKVSNYGEEAKRKKRSVLALTLVIALAITLIAIILIQLIM